MIQSVEARSFLELETVVLVDGSGKTWRFEARGKRLPLFTPSHLNEHKVLGVPVTVSYHREDGVLVLDDISD